jgi:hypothetical protein
MLLAALLAAVLAARGAFAAGPPLRVVIQPSQGTLEVLRGEQKLLVYAYATNQFKPYVRALYTLEGDNILRDAPADHLHHHGLMYAVRVNGTNFWEERQDPGHECSVKLLSHRVATGPTGQPEAVFTQLIHWVAAKDAGLADTTPAALLVEQRTLTLTVDEDQREVGLRWQAEFQAGPAAQKITLSGANYHGLGLRLPVEFDHAAQHQNSEGLPYSAAQRGDVTAARWSAVSHTINGHEVTIALFNRPSNAGQSRFFTMLDAFAYLSATQNLDQAPLTYSAGDMFRIDYLLTVSPGRRNREVLTQRYDRWLRAPPGTGNRP